MKQKQITLTVEQAKDILNDPDGIKALIRANFTEQELKGRVTKWEELGNIGGFYISASSSEVRDLNGAPTTPDQRNIYATEPQALAFGIAAPMLSQLMKEKNGDWVADWNNIDQNKYCIESREGIRVATYGTTKNFIALKDAESAKEFLSDHRDLITQYFAGF